MRLPILTYHSLDETGSLVSVSPAMFERHLARLHAAGYAVLPLREALARMAKPDLAQERIVALTFDDGYAASCQLAMRLLQRYGWRATVFAVGEYAGRTNAWPGQAAYVPAARLLSWSELRDLARTGWEIGAHSRTHPDLTVLSDRDLANEVLGAKALLEDQLGQAVQVFAYPYGRYDRRVRSYVQTAYTAACTTIMGIANQASDRHALPRLDMWYFSRPATYRLFASRWMGPYIALCRAGRRGRASMEQAIRRLLVQRSSAS